MNDDKISDSGNDRITARLEEIDATLDLYKAKAKRLKADKKADGVAAIAKLTNMRRKTAAELDHYKKASGSAAQKVGLGLQESLDTLSTALKEAGTILKESVK